MNHNLVVLPGHNGTVGIFIDGASDDVPTQFTYSIVGKQFLPGYSYNYTVTLDIKDGITVANWQESSWTADIDPDK